jgi:hypothetical protein
VKAYPALVKTAFRWDRPNIKDTASGVAILDVLDKAGFDFEQVFDSLGANGVPSPHGSETLLTRFLEEGKYRLAAFMVDRWYAVNIPEVTFYEYELDDDFGRAGPWFIGRTPLDMARGQKPIAQLISLHGGLSYQELLNSKKPFEGVRAQVNDTHVRLRASDTVEVIEQGRRETINDQTRPWFLVRSGQTVGWIFGEFLINKL